MSTDTAIIVFAKAPVPGQVKTRLIPRLGAEGAATLHQRLLGHALKRAASSSVGPLYLYGTPDTEHGFFQRLHGECELTLRTQRGKDLGERMRHALQEVLADHRQAILVGSDCPFLDRKDYLQASKALQEHDAVLGPAEDGGYVLVGVTGVVPDMFRAVEWGSARVLQQTRQRLQTLGVEWLELKAHRDIDRPGDLVYLEGLDWQGC